MRIDLNSDMGESFGAWTMGDDDAMLHIVSSANVAMSSKPINAKKTSAAPESTPAVEAPSTTERFPPCARFSPG